MIEIDLIVKYSILKRYQKEMDIEKKDEYIQAGIEELQKRIKENLAQHSVILGKIAEKKEKEKAKNAV